MHTPCEKCTRGVHTFWQKGVHLQYLDLFEALFNYKKQKALEIKGFALYQNWHTYLEKRIPFVFFIS